jgi:hypothetical protein
MTIQTEPAMFDPKLPIHTLTNIDREAGVVTLSNGIQVRLDSWGHIEAAQPLVGSKVQVLP